MIRIFSFSLILVSLIAQYAHASTSQDCLIAIEQLPQHFPADLSQRLRQPTLSYEQFVEQAEHRSRETALTPTGYDLDADLSRSRHWIGHRGPQMLQDLLPEGVSFINHQLINPMEAGVVKTDNGEFVSLRLEMAFQDKLLGTNIGVRRTALVDNLNRELQGQQKLLVSKDVRAVIVWLHGGGTRTTGFHVGAQALNHFASSDIDVFTLDAPWHGEGPRTFFKTDREYFEWLRAIVKKYIAPSGAPIFLVGHSMGGQEADRYMRLYPKDDLMTGVIPLSFVPDMKPGGNAIERLDAAPGLTQALRDPMLAKKIAHQDIKLSQDLMKQNKISPLGIWFETLLSVSNDWENPEHEGRDYIPALGIIGEFDWLYVGKEKLFKDHFQKLKNTEFFTLGVHPNMKGVQVPTGHLIFDIKEDLVFWKMREFMSRIAGKDLSPLPEDQRRKNLPLIGSLVQAYANNLAFREFTRSFLTHRRIPKNPGEIQILSDKASLLFKWLREYEIWKKREDREAQNAAKNGISRTPVALPPLAWENPLSPEEVRATHTKLMGIINGTGIDPAHKHADLGRSILDRLSLEEKALKIFSDERRKAKVDLIQSQNNLRVIEKSIDEKIAQTRSQGPKALIELDRKLDEAFENLQSEYSAVEVEIDRFYRTALSDGVASLEPEETHFDEQIKSAFNKFGAASEKYQRAVIEHHDRIREIALRGDLGNEIAEKFRQLRQAEAVLESTSLRSSELEQKYVATEDRVSALREELTRLFHQDWFKIEEIPLSSILAAPALIQDPSENTKQARWQLFETQLKQAWQRWLSLKRESSSKSEISIH